MKLNRRRKVFWLAIATTCAYFGRLPAVNAEIRYALTDLGSLGGATHTTGINSRGQVTGYSAIVSKSPIHAFLWTPSAPNGTLGSMLDIGTPIGTSSEGRGINNSGQ